MGTNFKRKRTVYRAVVIMLLLVSLIICLCDGHNSRGKAVSPVSESDISESKEVFSYKDLFRSYYCEAEREVMQAGGSICSFDDFCCGYYAQPLEIAEYTKKVALIATGREVNEDLPLLDSYRSAGSGGGYLLQDISDPDSGSDFNPNTTPGQAFSRTLTYNYFGRDAYGVLETGDIIMETRNTLLGFGHTGIIYDLNKPKGNIIEGDDNNTYVQTIDAVSPGVFFGFLDDTRILDYGVVFLRPICDQPVREYAADFCLRQVGDGYVLPFDAQPNRQNTRDDVIDFDYWSCAELVFSAYYNAGLDLGLIAPFLPYDIYYCGFVDYIQFNSFLDVAQEGKLNSMWRVRIFNSSNIAVTCEYNTNMCFSSDARNWSGLNDITSIVIPANQSVVVSISENYLADAIAISRTTMNGCLTRHITIVNDLNETLGRIDVEKKKILCENMREQSE